MYKLNQNNNELEKITMTTFSDNNLKERDNIEEWIRKDSSILGEEIIIIAHEYDKFEVNERLDLLGLDKDGNLVIIEVKRDKTGGNVDFQALKYCSYCSNLTPNEIVDIYDEYLKKFNIEEDALDNIMNFLEVDSEDLLNGLLNSSQRIIIIGKEIDKRILSVCAWLSQNNIDIKCQSIVPYLINNNEEIIIDVNQIIPPYNIEDYFINKKKVNKSKGKIVQSDEVIHFFNKIVSMANERGHKAYYNNRKPYVKIYSGIDSNLVFALVYKKREGQFRLELSARNSIVSEKLNDIYFAKKEYIENELQYSCEVKEGVKNSDWLRVYKEMSCDMNKGLINYTEEVGVMFIKFVEVLKKYLSKI
ncbi:hypothetical protein GOQ27_14330 [Clostridium sp. D2Q-11]|uniref:DUF4268 domain-containing protein n=1 Tax=Anaeromonas frigoriresistens TaxID=2683708 RepID=A0A942Z9T3_9FIRM|nr:hypothetical protein [Anaeromonas frigoriresistens]MBS4539648.1 hypothetical protein [Anaeromonas frigoriresistens]